MGSGQYTHGREYGTRDSIDTLATVVKFGSVALTVVAPQWLISNVGPLTEHYGTVTGLQHMVDLGRCLTPNEDMLSVLVRMFGFCASTYLTLGLTSVIDDMFLDFRNSRSRRAHKLQSMQTMKIDSGLESRLLSDGYSHQEMREKLVPAYYQCVQLDDTYELRFPGRGVTLIDHSGTVLAHGPSPFDDGTDLEAAHMMRGTDHLTAYMILTRKSSDRVSALYRVRTNLTNGTIGKKELIGQVHESPKYQSRFVQDGDSLLLYIPTAEYVEDGVCGNHIYEIDHEHATVTQRNPEARADQQC